jgi:peptidyl-prolyl cis-trans isomerase D
MAESIGGKIRNVLVGVLIGMLVLAFAVWGVNDMFTPGARNAVVTVGDNEISTQDFDALFTREVERLNRESSESVTNQQAYAQGLHTQILRSMITNEVVAIDADDLGVGVNRSIAKNEIEGIEAFQNDLTGKFDENKLNSALANIRMTRAQFEAQTLRSLRSEQTIPAITGGLIAPADFAALQYKFLTEQRRANVLTLNAEAVADPETPSDEVLKDYVNINQARYMAPEYRRFVMMRIEPFDFTPDLKIEPEQVRDAFDYKVETGEIGSPETRNVVLLSAPDEETVNKAVEALKSGQEPILVASSLNLDSPDIYDAVRANGLVDPESSKAAFELESGDARAVLSGLGSWVAVYVADITPAVVPDFEGSKQEIETELLQALALEAIYDVTGEIEDAMVDGLTLEEISEKVGVPLSAYDFVDRTGTTPYEVTMSGFSSIPGIASDDVILRTLFTSDLGFETDLFETATGGFASIRVDDIIDTKMKPFEDVREEALAAYLNDERADALRVKALEIKRRADAGETLQALKDEIGDGAELSVAPLVRTNPPRTLGPQITVALFDAEEGDIVRGSGPQPLTEQIAQLDRIIASQDGIAGTYLDVLQGQVAAAISSDIQDAYQRSVLADNPVQEYPDKIRSTLGLDQPN